jgi:hypothetical protein
MQGGGIFSIAVWPYYDLYILIQRYEKAQKTLHRKLPELTTQHFRNIRLADAEQSRGLDLFQAAFFHDGVDFEDQFCFDEVFLGVRQSQILEHIATSGFVFVPCHECSSLVQDDTSSAGRVTETCRFLKSTHHRFIHPSPRFLIVKEYVCATIHRSPN